MRNPAPSGRNANTNGNNSVTSLKLPVTMSTQNVIIKAVRKNLVSNNRMDDITIRPGSG